MEALEVQFQTCLTSTPDTVEGSTANRMEAVEVSSTQS